MDADCVYSDEDVGDMDDVLEVYCWCVRGYGYADAVVDGTGVVCRQRDACVKLMETLATGGSEADVSALSADEGSDWWSFPECLDDSSPLLKMRIQNPWWFWLARGGGVSVPLFGERERWRKLKEVVMKWRDTESGTQLMEPPGTRCIMVAMLWCAANEDVKMSCVQRMQNSGDR